MHIAKNNMALAAAAQVSPEDEKSGEAAIAHLETECAMGAHRIITFSSLPSKRIVAHRSVFFLALAASPPDRANEQPCLTPTCQNQNPVQLFETWLNEAKTCPTIREPTAWRWPPTPRAAESATYRTAQGFSDAGSRFYTNYGSPKGLDLTENGRRRFGIYWDPLAKQVRISGRVRRPLAK